MGYRFGGFELEQQARTLKREGQTIAVEPKVFDFVLYLIERRERLVGRQELLDAIWPGVVVQDGSLGRVAKEARRVLADDARHPEIIETKRGHGYRFVAPVPTPAPGPTGEHTPAHDPLTELAPPSSTVRVLSAAQTTVPGTTVAGNTATGDESGRDSVGIRWLFPNPGFLQLCADRPRRIGRGPECDAVLLGAEISRLHAEVFRDGPIWVIRDAGSRNGTRVNGLRVQQAAIAPGDILRFGDWVGLVAHEYEAPGEFRRLSGNLWGGDQLARPLQTLQELAARTEPVSIVGASGTGKRTAAALLHEWSARTGPLVTVRCAALRGDQGASELLGYVQPSGETSPGHAARAQGGTLLLHQLNELSPQLQPAVAWLLEAGEVTPLGSSQATAVDVRLVATMEPPRRDAGATTELRQDLATHLGWSVKLPSLREHVVDLPGLLAHLLRVHTGGHTPKVTAGLIERLCVYDWPGNIPELETTVRRLLVAHGTSRDALGHRHLPAELQVAASQRTLGADQEREQG